MRARRISPRLSGKLQHRRGHRDNAGFDGGFGQRRELTGVQRGQGFAGLLALQHQLLPPNINFREPDPELRLNIIANEARQAEFDCVLSNSFGFGGTNASIVLRKM